MSVWGWPPRHCKAGTGRQQTEENKTGTFDATTPLPTSTPINGRGSRDAKQEPVPCASSMGEGHFRLQPPQLSTALGNELGGGFGQALNHTIQAVVILGPVCIASAAR